MPQQSAHADVSMNDVVVRGHLVARRLADDMSWGEGSIEPQARDASAAARELLGPVLDAIEPVVEDEQAFSSCTDGRLPVRLQSDEPVPVREQLVGADMVSAFFVAECLGARFYVHPDAPPARRIHDVAAFLHENGIMPASHVGCGAAGGFEAIVRNILRFNNNSQYRARLKALLPAGVYDETLHRTMLNALQARLDAGGYANLSADTFLQVAQAVGGPRAVAELKDDGRGVRGHVEEAIVRLRLPGKALNTARLARETGGREVFGVNDTRMERLARLFARGAQDYRVAAMALEDFASSGHGTLARLLPTWLVTLN